MLILFLATAFFLILAFTERFLGNLLTSTFSGYQHQQDCRQKVIEGFIDWHHS